MANIGATTAYYRVETALTRANNEVSRSMERLATGRANANPGDRTSYVSMADTFRLDYVGTKAGLKNAAVVQGYLATAMSTLDSAATLLSRIQELAILGANQTNTTADANAIDAEAEALADELDRLLSTASYKGKDLFAGTAGGFGQNLAIDGRSGKMTFGVYDITRASGYDALYDDDEAAVSAGASTVAASRASGALAVKPSSAAASNTGLLTSKIVAVQALINTSRVQAGAQYAALDSTVDYLTSLTAQYELGFNTVNDVNFSMETAHLAKNQILQQAATAMLAQANQGQQGLLQLIQS